uniref:Uncharacterized protein n=1 Tax=viral metagenome TaxID=1070528 RepID=A0A6M3ISR9_9ZZZZ
MKQEPLTKEEFHTWKDNHFDHLCKDVARIGTDTKWLKWLNALIVAGILGLWLREILPAVHVGNIATKALEFVIR